MRTYIVYAPEIDTVSVILSGTLPFNIKAFTSLEEAKAYCKQIKPHVVGGSTVEIVTVKVTTNSDLTSLVNTLLTQQLKVSQNG